LWIFSCLSLMQNKEDVTGLAGDAVIRQRFAFSNQIGKRDRAMQTITKHDILTACRAAVKNGTLLALNPEAAEIGCAYRLGEFRCAIGVALNDETIGQIEDWGLNLVSVNRFVKCGIISLSKRALVW
jgi:hypothetical protein